jgi:hypothetical protein
LAVSGLASSLSHDLTSPYQIGIRGSCKIVHPGGAFSMALIEATSGVLSVIIGGASLYGQFRKINIFKEIIGNLQKIRVTPDGRQPSKDEALIPHWMDNGDLIAIQLKNRLIFRFIVLFIAIVGAVSVCQWTFLERFHRI